MASSGQITVYTESVDWPNYSRGACILNNVIGWSVDNSGNISFNSISSSDNVHGTWGVCTTGNGHLIMTVQVNYGSGWVDATSASIARATCPSLTNAISASITLIGMLGTAHLTGDCSLRILYYADLNPHPSSDLPNAFPSESYSAEVQVPVHVDVSWTATMNYDANGGTGAPSATTATASADTQTLTVSSTEPTKTNYRFDGWSYNGNTYHGGDTIVISKSTPTVTLTAVWTKFYHPGKIWNGSDWVSHDRDPGGDARVKGASAWVDMRTIDAPTGQNDPPSIYHDDDWYNMRDIGTH